MNRDKTKSVCFSGHRILDKGFDKKLLKKTVIDTINKGYTIFYNGLALGFDREVFKILVELKKEYDIKIIGCIPCKDQDGRYRESQKKVYKENLKSCDEVIILSEEYTPYCMFERNRFMVDNSSLLICYQKYMRGGTYYTFNYAKKCGINIINLANVDINYSFLDRI